MTNNFVVKNLDGVEEANELIDDEPNNYINFTFLLLNIFHLF